MDQDYLRYKKYKKKYQELKKLLEGGKIFSVKQGRDIPISRNRRDDSTSEIQTIDLDSTLEKFDIANTEKSSKKTNGGLIGGLFLGGAAILAMVVGIIG